MSLTFGSLFAGIGGIDLALESLGMTCGWHVEFDPHASHVLANHWPDVPNHHDITSVDWAAVAPVDVLCGGFPCQDISLAGKGAGIKDGTRSGLWSYFADAISVLRPRYVLIENVSALAVRGLDRVLCDLAEIGFDAEWTCLRASDVGAPHRRERIFILATDARGQRWQPRTGLCGGDETGDGRGFAHDNGGETAPNADSFGLERLPAQHGSDIGLDITPRNDIDGLGLVAWGDYELAIRRWASLTRHAPPPTDDRGRLSVSFVEWMMGFPEGWVDGIPRSQQLKTLGNAVLPQQAMAALDLLLPASEAAA